jgi:hypothetical protein
MKMQSSAPKSIFMAETRLQTIGKGLLWVDLCVYVLVDDCE